jgi:hypothetical protein
MVYVSCVHLVCWRETESLGTVVSNGPIDDLMMIMIIETYGSLVEWRYGDW